MGFYGNITNTSNTTFSFDRIYPNRLAMDSNANNDGIFIGRYVLVEYDQDAAYPVVFINKKTNKFYSSKNFDQATEIRYISGDKSDEYILTIDTSVVLGKQYYKLENDKYIDVSLNSNDNPSALGLYEYVSTSDGVYKDEIVQVQEVTFDEKTGNLITIFIGFYQCEGAYDGKHAQFKQLDKDPNAAKSNYIKNFAIDEKHLNGEQQKSFKGYDSTVWMKSSVTASDGKLITKYVNIADLNSVVPTFDIAADAPTMVPITPHFDADSTNVYYKLHMQTPFGFRVKENTKQSDQTTTHYETVYDKNGNITSQNKRENVKADIFYNKNALEYKPNDKTNRVEIEPKGQDEIKLTIGKSTDYDTKYQHYTEGDVQGDIQELSIHLPSVGYMVSQGWDIIHGPNRDDAQTDNNSSLQGRLDSFKAMEKNAIPMKRNSDGAFVGSRINGNNFREVADNTILKENLSTSFDEDDAWIRTEIDTVGLDNKNKLSGISIHHTFHPDNTNYDFPTNKNVDDVESENESDKIKIYTPKVDAAGHVVGKSIETVTLPYGYKTIKVENTDDKSVSNAAQSIVVDGQSADNTQDILTLSASNRWIKLDNSEDDKIKIGHEVNPITITDNIPDTDLNIKVNNNIQNIINIPDWSYDVAGHIIAKQNHKYTLPFGYKTFTDGTNNSVANSTQDTFTFVGDSWLKPTVSEDQITYTHIGPVNGTDLAATSASPKFKGAFDIVTWEFDKLGHKNQKNKQTITLPTLTKEDNDINSTGYNLISNIEFIDDDAQGQKLQVTRKLVGEVPITNYALADKNEKLNASDTINQAFGKLQAQINALDLEENSSTTQFISKISQIDGKVAVERAAAGTLQLGTASTDDTIPATSSLNNAFNITNARIKKEEDALAKEIQDRKDAIDALTGTKDYSEHFDTMKEIADWLDTNKDGVVDITLNVSANATAIRDEKTRAEGIEAGLQEQIEALQTWKETATEDIANLNNTISQLQTTIESLQKQIDDLKNPPQEPDEGGEIV